MQEKQLIAALGLPDTASEEEIISAVQSLKRLESVRNVNQEYQDRINQLRAVTNMSVESAIECLLHQDTEKKRQQAEAEQKTKTKGK